MVEALVGVAYATATAWRVLDAAIATGEHASRVDDGATPIRVSSLAAGTGAVATATAAPTQRLSLGVRRVSCYENAWWLFVAWAIGTIVFGIGCYYIGWRARAEDELTDDEAQALLDYTAVVGKTSEEPALKSARRKLHRQIA